MFRCVRFHLINKHKKRYSNVNTDDIMTKTEVNKHKTKMEAL